MTDTGRDRKLLDEERSRLLELKESLTQATEDVERGRRETPAREAISPMPGRRCSSDPETSRSSRTSTPNWPTSSTPKARLANGSYGICEACGKPIGAARLAARPATRFCIEDQQGAEREVQIG